MNRRKLYKMIEWVCECLIKKKKEKIYKNKKIKKETNIEIQCNLTIKFQTADVFRIMKWKRLIRENRLPFKGNIIRNLFSLLQ